MVRDRIFFRSLFDVDDADADVDVDRGTMCDGGGMSNTDCKTDGGETRPGDRLAASRRDAPAMPRTTAQRAEQHGEERVADVARRFGLDGDVAIGRFDLRFARPSTMTGGRHCWERKESRLEGSWLLLIWNSAVGDDRASMQSSAGLAITLTLIPSGGGVGRRVVMQSSRVLV